MQQFRNEGVQVNFPVGKQVEVFVEAGEQWRQLDTERRPPLGTARNNVASWRGLPLQHDGRRTVTCFAAIDNLIKGGAGQAIQNMNLMLGCDERASLEDVGNWP